MIEDLIGILLCGTLLMCIPIAFQMRWGGIAPWKSIFISMALVVTGVYASQLWYLIENGHFGGRSFYGAVVFSPVVFFPLAKLLRVPYGIAMDYVAPAGCLTLALVKIQCLRDQCCAGMILYVDENYHYVRFPSQLVEMIAFLLLSVILFLLAHDLRNQKTIFLWFLVLYGASRFGLDFLREIRAPYALGLSAGSFWSLCSFIIGLGLLLFVKIRRKKKGLAEKSTSLQEDA